MMNKTKLSIILIVSALVLLFSSCGAMVVEDTDNVSIDLSSVISRATVNPYAKVRLVAVGTNNFFPLPDGQAFQPVVDGKIALTDIPVGPDYTIYISVGSWDAATEVFSVVKAINGDVSVTGGATTDATLIAVDILAAPVGFTGQEVKGTAYFNSKVYSIVGNKLFDGTTDLGGATGFTFNSITAGYNNMGIISCANEAGEGFVKVNGAAIDDTFADALPAEIEGDNKALDIISSDVFWDDTEELELVIGQTNGGLILSVQDFTGGEEMHDWMVMDLGPLIAEIGLELKGKLINGISVVKKYNGTDVTALWIFMASQAGDYRIVLPLDASGFEVTPEGDETEMDAIMKIFQPFKDDNALDGRTVLDIGTPGGDTIYVATDQGLYKATATAEVADMAPAVVAGAGKRIESLAVGSDYTACVTALNLYIVKNSDNKVATIAFNEGLPVTDMLTEGAITGLSWDEVNDVLYVSGNYGLVSVDTADLTFE